MNEDELLDALPDFVHISDISTLDSTDWWGIDGLDEVPDSVRGGVTFSGMEFAQNFDAIQGPMRRFQENPVGELDREGTIEFDGVSDLIKPTIIGPEGREVQPVYTEEIEVVTDNDTRVHKSLCGDTKVEGIGEDEWNVTIEGIVIEDQLKDLIEMRPADNEIKVIIGPKGERAPTYDDVVFDRFVYRQTDEMNVGQFEYDGQQVVQPIYEFQLQTQDDDAP